MVITSLAVARFESDVLGFGLAVLLTEHLAGVASLRVVPARQALSDELSPEELGRRSGVDAVLSGSMRVVRDALEIDAFLVDPLAEREVWRDRYAVQCADVLLVCRRVAERVSDAAGYAARFGRRAPATARTWDAFCAYAGARHLDWLGDDEALPRAARLYERAMVLVPSLRAAAAGHAYVVISMIADGRADVRQLDAAAARADEILRRDRTLADAHAAAGLASLLRGDARKAELLLRRAATLDPISVKTRRWLADALDALGRAGEAARERQAAVPGEPALSLHGLHQNPQNSS